MKHSIRFKITFTLTVMIVAIIFLTWFINRTFLSPYYVQTKIKVLDNAYDEIVDVYKSSVSDGYLSDTDTEKIERLETKYNVKVNVFNIDDLAMIYPAPGNYGKRENASIMLFLMGYIFPGSNPSMSNITKLRDTENYIIYQLYDQQMDTRFMDLLGLFKNPVENVIQNNNIEFYWGSDNSEGSTKQSVDNSDSANQNASSAASSNAQPGTQDDSSAANAAIGNGKENLDNSMDNTSGNTSDNTTDKAANGSSGNTDKKSQDSAGNRITEDNQKCDTLILIRSNFESIEESAQIANRFLSYIGIIVVILGTMAMFIVSKSFTKPILDLAGIAKKMTDLNFDIKYKVKSKDEIGELGKSINLLSDKLETTITELKHANNELKTDIQKKTEIDEMRKEFLSNVSHELKTPISLIQGYAEGLKENINDDEESRDFYCEVIMDEANKMNQMVKKLLSLNELEFGNNQVNFERFDIVSLIRSVLNATEILFKQKEVTLHFEQTEPVYVWADEYLIEQVITNYISNALNHVSGQKIIEIKLIPRENTIRVAVLNTGDNIPEDELDKLWIKFYKVDKARTREYGGSGIGLSIVKAIMNTHNRECGVINRPVGVEFWFELDTKS